MARYKRNHELLNLIFDARRIDRLEPPPSPYADKDQEALQEQLKNCQEEMEAMRTAHTAKFRQWREEVHDQDALLHAPPKKLRMQQAEQDQKREAEKDGEERTEKGEAVPMWASSPGQGAIVGVGFIRASTPEEVRKLLPRPPEPDPVPTTQASATATPPVAEAVASQAAHTATSASGAASGPQGMLERSVAPAAPPAHIQSAATVESGSTLPTGMAPRSAVGSGERAEQENEDGDRDDGEDAEGDNDQEGGEDDNDDEEDADGDADGDADEDDADGGAGGADENGRQGESGQAPDMDSQDAAVTDSNPTRNVNAGNATDIQSADATMADLLANDTFATAADETQQGDISVTQGDGNDSDAMMLDFTEPDVAGVASTSAQATSTQDVNTLPEEPPIGSGSEPSTGAKPFLSEGTQGVAVGEATAPQTESSTSTGIDNAPASVEKVDAVEPTETAVQEAKENTLTFQDGLQSSETGEAARSYDVEAALTGEATKTVEPPSSMEKPAALGDA